MMLIGMTMALVALSIAPSWLEQRAVALQAVGLVTEVVPCATWLQMGTDDDGCVVILHMAADAPEVDVWLDGAESGVTLAYLEDSGYLAVPAGEHEVALVPAGGDLADAVWSGALSIAGGVIYHAAASGSVADGSFGVKVWTRYGGKMPEGKAIIEFMQVGSAAGVTGVFGSALSRASGRSSSTRRTNLNFSAFLALSGTSIMSFLFFSGRITVLIPAR